MCQPKQNKKYRNGAALEHGKAHQMDHINYSRRTFIHNLSVMGGVSLLLGNTPLTALGHHPFSQMLSGSDSDRILVLIRLKGGNDGLNTIIPIHDYGTYQQKRPTIAIPQNQLTTLNSAYAMPNYMQGLINKWQDGQSKIIQNVGYPDQNLSHFRSSDIWASGSTANAVDGSGWLGRYLENEFPDFIINPPAHPPAVQIGGTGNLVFNNRAGSNMGIVVNDPEQLAEIALNGQLYDPINVPDCFRGEQVSYLRTVANSTFRYAEVLNETYNSASNQEEYTQSEIGQQLAIVARLIKGGLSTKLYMVTLDGFDTHARQNEIHPYLMSFLSNAIEEFYSDLEKSDDAKRVLSMTFSEFGRRIEQNASNGTDHGAAAPLMLFGPMLNGNGFIGNTLDLNNVDEVGNLNFDIDFRQIYASMLEQWLCIHPNDVNALMGSEFDRIQNLGLPACNLSTSITKQSFKSIRHWLSQDRGQIKVFYELSEGASTRLFLHNIMGQLIFESPLRRDAKGLHYFDCSNLSNQMIAGPYVYSLQVGRERFSRQFSYLP